MLLFISFASASIALVFLFQYISCYSLSICCQISTVVISRFNTSHVTLYHVYGRCFYRRSLSFNTSHVTLYHKPNSSRAFSITVSIHLMLLFIAEFAEKYLESGSFNTSHVTLYRRAGSALPGGKESFNTSHVTLYQEFGYDPEWPEMFQYISCYSLSPPLSFFLNTQHVFQYISCYSLSL